MRTLMIITAVIPLHNILIPTFEARELHANSTLLTSFAREVEVITGKPQRIASPLPDEIPAGNEQTMAFPEDFFGVWIAKNSDYVEPNGWEDWYRVLDIHKAANGAIFIQYGSLVGSEVIDVEYDGETYTIWVTTEFNEETYYCIQPDSNKILVKAPEIIRNYPDAYKEYLRLEQTNHEKE
jgi:hypothetical protein